ncbi:hypothetical protein F4212_02015 [Candidatus Poribacteria bacterium]|nr:hypothetical protein [Candidatus Poribacteria bacterium]
MELLQNPFHILSATTRDSRQRIIELAQEANLLSDTDECDTARDILIHPKKRIDAEVAWLPGFDVFDTDKVLKQLKSPDEQLLHIIEPTHIALANILVSGLSRLPNPTADTCVDWILAIAKAAEAIDPETIRTTFNADRSSAGFPQINDMTTIEEAIHTQKKYYRTIITVVMEKIDVIERTQMMTTVVEKAIGNQISRCPPLIDDLVTSYEYSVKQTLENKQQLIEAQDKQIRDTFNINFSEYTLTQTVDQLIDTVKAWDTIAQPIQLSKRSRGERHNESFKIAAQCRDLAAALFLEQKNYDIACKIINMLQDVFAEVPELLEYIKTFAQDLEQQVSFIKQLDMFERIKTQTEDIEKVVDAQGSNYLLAPLITELIQTVKTWDTSAPVEANSTVAIVVRNTALHLWNEHLKLDEATKITETLIEVFLNPSKVDSEVANRLTLDRATLMKLSSLQLRSEQPRSEQPRSGDTGCLYQIIFIIIALIAVLLQGC